MWHGQKSWNGVAVLAKGSDPVERQRGLAGDPEDEHSRYLENAKSTVWSWRRSICPTATRSRGPNSTTSFAGSIGCISHATELLVRAIGAVVLAGDYNVIPTELDVYKPERWVDDALFRPEVRDAYRRLAVRSSPPREASMRSSQEVRPTFTVQRLKVSRSP